MTDFEGVCKQSILQDIPNEAKQTLATLFLMTFAWPLKNVMFLRNNFFIIDRLSGRYKKPHGLYAVRRSGKFTSAQGQV